VGGLALTVLALVAPLVLAGPDLRLAHRMLALLVIFVSIVCITGFSGHLTLGQASIAGFGAFFAARSANAFGLPVVVAMLFGALAAAGIGLVAGFPALKRKGLFLGLTTLALALIIDRFVFNEELLQGGPGGLTVERPSLFGLRLEGDIAFYFFELAIVAVVLILARNLQSGRLGRVLSAMRDSETASESVGIRLRRAKLFVFGVSAAMAGVGGAMLTQANENWDTATFNPVLGLFWFVAVVVCGITTVWGAVLAAILYVLLPRLLDLEIQKAIGLFGLAAVFLGYMPGGLSAQLSRMGRSIQHQVVEQYKAARRPAPAPPPTPAPSAFAERILAERVLADRGAP
jgi:branched-chain amino acid transport system permease protein